MQKRRLLLELDHIMIKSKMLLRSVGLENMTAAAGSNKIFITSGDNNMQPGRGGPL
jgi:hypothetical protein